MTVLKPILDFFWLFSFNSGDLPQALQRTVNPCRNFIFSRKVGFFIFILLPNTDCSWNNICIFLAVRSRSHILSFHTIIKFIKVKCSSVQKGWSYHSFRCVQCYYIVDMLILIVGGWRLDLIFSLAPSNPVYVLFTNPSARAGYNTRSIFNIYVMIIILGSWQKI